MTRVVLFAIVIIALFAAFHIPGASALQIDLTPAQIQEGGQVTITIRGLEDNSIFAINIKSDVKPQADGTFEFRTTNFYMPFTLENGNILVEAHNVMDSGTTPDEYAAGIQTKPPGSSGTISILQGEYPAGVVKIYDRHRTIPVGTFDFISIFGYAKDGATVVPVTFELNGKKQGSADSELSFSIMGVSSGAADIVITVNGNVGLTKTVTIEASPSTTTETTPAQTSVMTWYQNIPLTTTSQMTGSPQPTESTTPAPTGSAGDIVLSSIDRQFTLHTSGTAVSGSSPDDLRVMDVGTLALAPGWNALTDTYLVFPDTTRFSPEATVSFTLDDATFQNIDHYNPFIAFYDGTTWIPVETRRDGVQVLADVSTAGKYALATESRIEAAEPAAQQIHGTPASETTQSPVPAAAETTETATQTRKSGPAGMGVILVSVAAMFLARYKDRR